MDAVLVRVGPDELRGPHALATINGEAAGDVGTEDLRRWARLVLQD